MNVKRQTRKNWIKILSFVAIEQMSNVRLKAIKKISWQQSLQLFVKVIAAMMCKIKS
jgi:hypothetical protein